MGSSKLKDTSPQASASYISLLLFSWLDPLVWAGWKRPLRQHDLPAVSQEVIAFSVMGCGEKKYDNMKKLLDHVFIFLSRKYI